MSHSLHHRTPQNLFVPHPGIQKLAETLFIMIYPDSPEEMLVTAAEISEYIKADATLRSNNVPHRFPLAYQVFANHFNSTNSVDNRRFTTLDNNGVPQITGEPCTHEDFGIEKVHTGLARLNKNSIDRNPAKRAWVHSKLWDTVLPSSSASQITNNPHSPSPASKRRRMESPSISDPIETPAPITTPVPATVTTPSSKARSSSGKSKAKETSMDTSK